MTNHCYLVGISKDGNSELDDFYLVVVASKNAANVLVQSTLVLNERAVTTAQWSDHVVNDRTWRGTGDQRISLEKVGAYPLHTVSWA